MRVHQFTLPSASTLVRAMSELREFGLTGWLNSRVIVGGEVGRTEPGSGLFRRTVKAAFSGTLTISALWLLKTVAAGSSGLPEGTRTESVSRDSSCSSRRQVRELRRCRIEVFMAVAPEVDRA